jgi:hypothetical protein
MRCSSTSRFSPIPARTGLQDSDLWGRYTSGRLPFQLSLRHTKPILVLMFMGRRFYGCMGPRVHEQMASTTSVARSNGSASHIRVTSHRQTLLWRLRAPAAAYNVYTRTHAHKQRRISESRDTDSSDVDRGSHSPCSPANVGKRVSCMDN